MSVALISAGAAKGLVQALAARFTSETGEAIEGTFGAVGAMKDKLMAGVRCDVLILPQPMLETLANDGRVDASTIAPLGYVYTGVAVRAGDTDIAIDTSDALRQSLLAATSVFIPDPDRATAGIHFMRVLDQLGVRDGVASRLRPFPNGAAAMAQLAQASDAHPVGCTQVTEIRYTPGVRLVGKLPREFELATLYSAAVCIGAHDVPPARKLVNLLCGAGTRALRRDGGFE